MPGNVALTLPPKFEVDVSVAVTSPQVRFSFAFDQAPGALTYEGTFAQVRPSSGDTLLWWGSVSPGWLGTASRATYTFPDLSGLAG